MPVFSFLAYPETGLKDQLIRDLSQLPHCEVNPSENKEVLILVTDTPDDETQKRLMDRVKGLKSLQSLSMTFGHSD